MEPLISSRQRDRVLGYIETGRQEGASVAYGLSGAVFGSPERAAAVAARIRTGTVSVNNGLWFGPDVPFGGYKQSGIGREMGRPGFEEYLETKSIASPA
jgi:aldehyde dehydrogenase (NAD+)